MKTSIDIDHRLLQQATRLTGNRSKEATAEAGLRLLVQMQAQEDIRQLRSKVRWQGITGKGTTSSRVERAR